MTMTLGRLYPRLLEIPGVEHIARLECDARGRVGPAALRPHPRVVIRGIGDSSTGYGQMVAHLAEEVEAQGIAVHFENIHHDEARRPIDDRLKSRLLAPEQDGPVLLMAGPWTTIPPRSLILTMWEATRIAPSAVNNLNTSLGVIVPCDDNARWLRDSGVVAPIRVVALGIDPTIHHPRGRREHEGFVVGAAGRVGPGGGRKGLHRVIAAFLEAFPGDDSDARLEIKCFEDCAIATFAHPRIRFVREALSDDALADWNRGLDLFVSASLGEGFGLQPIQAMACGVPVAGAWWGGHSQYMTQESTWPVEFDEEIASDPYVTEGARWCVVRHESLVDRMREAHGDRAACRAKGEAAAIRAAEFTWERSGRELAGVIREFGLDHASPSPAGAFVAMPAPEPPSIEPGVRDAISACPDRGGVLPISMQREGCGCGELSECRARKGRTPGRVGLRDCIECKSA